LKVALNARLGLPPAAAPWRCEVALCHQYWNALSEWEHGFMESMEGRRNEPTDKQMAVLRRIVRRLQGR
jgi:hypothetical protein